MALALARTASWLTFLSRLAAVRADSSFWTATSRFQYSESHDYYTQLNGEVTDLGGYTSTRTLKSGVTPSATPASTTTAGSYYSSDDDVEYVYIYYDQDVVPESDLEPDVYDVSYTGSTTSSEYTYRLFNMPVTYTAPASCPTQFTWTGQESVTVPSAALDQVTPTSKDTVAPTSTGYLGGPTETWWLSASAAPLTTSIAFNYKYYVADCSTPYSSASYTGYSGGYGGGSSGGNDVDVCSWYSGCTSFRTWIIIIACLIPGIFLLGFLESWFWFRRLMLGKGCLRFGTLCWIFISLLVLCFTRTQSRRSPEDQKLLREKWSQMGSGTAFKLWWKWGFRHAYPVEHLGQYSRNTVGIVPAGQPLPQMVSVTYPQGPPPPGAVYVTGGPQGQQYYYPPPQGWQPGPQGQGYPMPPPGQFNTPPPQGQPTYYGEQNKEAPSVSEAPLSPIQQTPQPVPSSPVSSTVPSPPVSSTVPSPPPNVAEAYQPPQHPPPGNIGQAYQPPQHPPPTAQLPTAPGSPPPPQRPT